MWQEYFKLIKIKPGRVDTALFGVIDFSDPKIPLEKIVALYESDFPYLQITPTGMDAVYGTVKPEKSSVQSINVVKKTHTKPVKYRKPRK